MKLLYITRKYPPMVGGLERLSFSLSKEFVKLTPTTVISWGRSQKFLPIIFPLFFIKSLYFIYTRKIEHIHIGDGLLSPLGLVLKKMFGIKTTCTVVGLDVTFNFPGYQFIVINCLKRLDKIICISDAAKYECTKRGISKDKCVVIPCGVYPNEFILNSTGKDLAKLADVNLEGKKVIITVGRLVKRKGVYWFLNHVISNLDKKVIYFIIGDGPERVRIEELITKLKLNTRVKILGKISDRNLKIVYNAADLFIMPNIKVKGDIEGFGIVAIEASAAGLCVVASNLEGISTAVVNNKNGYLVESENKSEWIRMVDKSLYHSNLSRQEIRKWTKENFHWNAIGASYVKEFEKL